ncbi:MAG: hypothetical protein JSS14_02380 [Proteobacteria bacterium]|nr:hypothetical protein [Pseudomonadota bacterium]
MTRKTYFPHRLAGAAVLGALAALFGAAASAQQHVEDARVLSSTPLRNADGTVGYSVTYEFNGRQYTTRTDSPPGDYIQLQMSPMGVVTSQPAPDAAPGYTSPMADGGGNAEPWRNVAPEPGVVLSGSSGMGPAPAPVYTAPPVVYAPAPVYAPPPAYGYYGYPYAAYPPIGVSLNLGYSYWRGGRGWH